MCKRKPGATNIRCRQYHLMAARSGLPFSQCDHIRSLEHCSKMASEEWLKEEVLSEMVKLKFFGEATCTKRQKNALKAHVPLCVQVSFKKKSQTILLFCPRADFTPL